MIKYLFLMILILNISQSLCSNKEKAFLETNEESPLKKIIDLSNRHFFARKIYAQEAIRGASIINNIKMLSKEIMNIADPSDYSYKTLQKALEKKYVDFSLFELDIRFSNDDGSVVTTEQYRKTLRRTHNEYKIVAAKYTSLNQKREVFIKNQDLSQKEINALLINLKTYKDILEKESTYLSIRLIAQEHYDALKKQLSPDNDLARILKESIAKLHLKKAYNHHVFQRVALINHNSKRTEDRLISKIFLSQGEK